MKDTNKLELGTCKHESVTIFDIKTKTHVSNVYRQIEWEMVEHSTKLFENKFNMACQNKTVYFNKVNLIISNLGIYPKVKLFEGKFNFHMDNVTQR